MRETQKFPLTGLSVCDMATLPELLLPCAEFKGSVPLTFGSRLVWSRLFRL